MNKRHLAPVSTPALSAEDVAERLRAHARLCRQIAHESWNETIAAELTQLADRCLQAANHIEPKPGPRLH